MTDEPRELKRFGSLLLVALLAACGGSEPEGTPPNIIFLMADDLGYAELGSYGQAWIQTPNIDSIAMDGIRFTGFYSGQAVCAPSRASLLTGKHQGRAHIRDTSKTPEDLAHLGEQYGWEFPGQYPLASEEVTIAEILKEKGYATAVIGKWGLGQVGTTGDPNQQGFDLFYGYNCQWHAHDHYPTFLWRNDAKENLPGNDATLTGETYSEDRFREESLAFIRENQDRPFFLYLAFAIPHLSIQVPDESLEQYKDTIPEEDYVHWGPYVQHPYPRAGYAAMVSHMDRDIGEILALVDELGLTEKTLVMFTSDNGPTYNRLGGSDSEFFESAGPLRGLKGSLYEGGIRVPLVAKWPGKIEPGQTTQHMAAFWDVLPTLTEIAGAAAPAEVDGISFAPTLLGQPRHQAKHEFLYWEFRGYGGQQVVHMGDWKGVRQSMLRASNPDPLKIELYNLAEDVGETRDVAADYPEIVEQIRAIMQREHRPSPEFPFPPLDGYATPVPAMSDRPPTRIHRMDRGASQNIDWRPGDTD